MDHPSYDSLEEWARNEEWLPALQSAKDLPDDIFIRDEIRNLDFNPSDLKHYPDELLWSRVEDVNRLWPLNEIYKQSVFCECAASVPILAFPIKNHHFESTVLSDVDLDCTVDDNYNNTKALVDFCPDGKLPSDEKQANAIRVCFLEMYYWVNELGETC